MDTIVAFVTRMFKVTLPGAYCRASIKMRTALTQDICYPTVVVASCNLLPVRMQAGATYDE
ncbi:MULTISPECIES: hypothetical protein, partial [Burkholderia]|uniref:hypothetical protein n=1 Tax=Burkholderia TaxID=32008 RepID=UPI001C43122F